MYVELFVPPTLTAWTFSFLFSASGSNYDYGCAPIDFVWRGLASKPVVGTKIWRNICWLTTDISDDGFLLCTRFTTDNVEVTIMAHHLQNNPNKWKYVYWLYFPNPPNHHHHRRTPHSSQSLAQTPNGCLAYTNQHKLNDISFPLPSPLSFLFSYFLCFLSHRVITSPADAFTFMVNANHNASERKSGRPTSVVDASSSAGSGITSMMELPLAQISSIATSLSSPLAHASEAGGAAYAGSAADAGAGSSTDVIPCWRCYVVENVVVLATLAMALPY